MNEIRVSAKNVSDAITEASIQLGVTSSELEYEVIEKGSTGFLGIGSKQAVIRAWKKVVEEPVEEVREEVEEVKPRWNNKLKRQEKLWNHTEK
jgi:spoIIIJ-associated protein